MGDNANNGPRTQCTNGECISIRQRFGGVAASRAIAIRDLDRMQTRLRIAETRNGGNAGLGDAPRIEYNPTAPAHEQRESAHMLSERLKALDALIREQIAKKEGEDLVLPIDALLKELKDRKAANDAAGGYFDMDLYLQTEMLQGWVNNAKVEAQPYTCIVCTKDLAPGDAMLGKHCYHYYHPSCVLRQALEKLCPVGYTAVHDSLYFDCVGTEAEAGRGDLYKHELKPELKAAFDQGRCPVAFPAGIWTDCPECRTKYANSHYFNGCQSVRASPPADPTAAAAADAAAAEGGVAEYRAQGGLLLLAVPGDDALVMMVRAKVPRSAAHPVLDKQDGFTKLLRAEGYRWGVVGNEGGRGFYREKEYDDVLDALPTGASVRMTEAPLVDTWVEDGVDSNGERVKRQKKMPRGKGGTYKVDLPAAAPPVVPPGQAGPSYAAAPVASAVQDL